MAAMPTVPALTATAPTVPSLASSSDPNASLRTAHGRSRQHGGLGRRLGAHQEPKEPCLLEGHNARRHLGHRLRIVLKGDMLPKPPQAICAEECKKLKVVFVFHMDADEALPHLPGWRFYKVPPVGGLRECH